MATWMLRVVQVLIFASVNGGQGDRGCPDDVLSSAASCLPRDFSDGLVSNLSAIHRYCREDLFARSVQCLSALEASCRDDPDDDLLLHHLLDLRAWEAGWNNLCAHLKELEQHYACWAMTLQMSTACIKAKMAEFRFQVTSEDDGRPPSAPSSSSLSLLPPSPRPITASKRSQTAEMMDSFRIYCNVSQQILHCFLPTLNKLCPLATSRLLENTYLAFQPPLCLQRDAVSEDGYDEDTIEKSVTSSGAKPLSCQLEQLVWLIFAVINPCVIMFR